MTRTIVFTRGRLGLFAALGLFLIILASAVEPPIPVRSAEQNQGADPKRDLLEQGRYIVHDVAMCVVCHSPKNNRGDVVESQLLEGASIPVDGPYPNQPWALRAPSLAGLPGGWTPQSLTEFLMTGQTPAGHTVRPPMPPYRMKKDDAQAVTAYLQSLSAGR